MIVVVDTETTGLDPVTDRVVEIACVPPSGHGARSFVYPRRLSTKAVVLRKVGFGKHFGSLWADVPLDYLEWCARQDFDPDVKFTVKSELARRASR